MSGWSGWTVDCGVRDGSCEQPLQALEPAVVGELLPSTGAAGGHPQSERRHASVGHSDVADRVAQEVVRRFLEPCLEPVFHANSYGYRPGRSAIDAVHTTRQRCWRYDWVLDIDIKAFLDTASYCPLVHEVRSKSSGCGSTALIRSPFCLPRMTWTASSSPRLTRCNTVWRETPSAFIASRMGMNPSPASLLNRAMTSWVSRMRHGAPGVSCSPGMIPALSNRWRVEGATPSSAAAVLMVKSSPSACAALGSKHGISQCRRTLPTRPASKRWPYAVVRPWRLRMPAITVSG